MKPAVALSNSDFARTANFTQAYEAESQTVLNSKHKSGSPRQYGRFVIVTPPTAKEPGIGTMLSYDEEQNLWLVPRERGFASSQDDELLVSLMGPTARFTAGMLVTACHIPGVGYGIVDFDRVGRIDSTQDMSYRMFFRRRRESNSGAGDQYSNVDDVLYAPDVVATGPEIQYSSDSESFSFKLYGVTDRFPAWVRLDKDEERTPALGEVWNCNANGLLIRESLYLMSHYGGYSAGSAFKAYDLSSQLLSSAPAGLAIGAYPYAQIRAYQPGPWFEYTYNSAGDINSGGVTLQGILLPGDYPYNIAYTDALAETPDEYTAGAFVGNMQAPELWFQYGFKILAYNAAERMALVNYHNAPMLQKCVARTGSRFDFVGDSTGLPMNPELTA